MQQLETIAGRILRMESSAIRNRATRVLARWFCGKILLDVIIDGVDVLLDHQRKALWLVG